MTNLDIIVAEAIANKLYSKEEVEAIFAEGRTLPLHTYAGWKARGYQVKKGEHATITTRLWKYRNKKVSMKDTNGNEIEQDAKNCYLVNSFLFTLEQVQVIEG